MSWLKRRLPKKRWKRVCVYLASFLLILVAADMILVQCWRRIEISSETTNITSPLNAAGFPDYLAAINQEYGKGVTLENNAMPLLLKITGTGEFPESLRTHSFPLIGVSPEPKPSSLLSFDQWHEKSSPATQNSSDEKRKWVDIENDLLTTPWTKSGNLQAAQWIASQKPVLQLAYQATERPCCFLPLNEESADPAKIPRMIMGETLADVGPYMGQLRRLANLLASDAMRCVGEGDQAGFARDTVATMRLARLAAQGPTLLENLNALAIDGRASRTAHIGATHAGFLSTAQAENLLHTIDSLPPLPSAARAIDTSERWFFLHDLCFRARFGGLFGPLHVNAGLRDVNRYYDQFAACIRLPTYRQQKATCETLKAEFADAAMPRLSAIVNPTIFFAALEFSSVQRLPAFWQEARINHDLVRLALALAAYRADRGAYPESLTPLAPDYLKEIPLDGFIDAPLKYRTQGKGYLLYSVGPDEKDDGGTDRAASNGKNWDIVVRAAE